MRFIYLAIFCFTILPISVNAGTNEKIERLMKAQGVLEVFQEQIELSRTQGRQYAEKMLDQLMSQLNPSEKYKKRFKEISNKFISKLIGNWSAEELVSAWSKVYAPKFTDSELDQLIKFYTSDIGQKEVKVSKIALSEFSMHFQQKNDTIMKNAINEYVADLKLVAQECNCKRK